MLSIKPTDKVLEIGCGTGIAVELIAEKLTHGSIIAIDQSPSMIEKASRRNLEFTQNKKATFITGKLADLQFPEFAFDKIFAFNVSVFWKNPKNELHLIRNSLASNGTLYLFHQPPWEVTKNIAEKATEHLKKNNYEVTHTFFKEMVPASVFCITAKPTS